jgi:hypothetical protein
LCRARLLGPHQVVKIITRCCLEHTHECKTDGIVFAKRNFKRLIGERTGSGQIAELKAVTPLEIIKPTSLVRLPPFAASAFVCSTASSVSGAAYPFVA